MCLFPCCEPDSAKASMARLILKTDDAPRTYQLDKKVTYIGRKSTCDILITDGSASRHHARIINDANDYLVVDTQSKNGMLVNGQKVPQKFLSEGDYLQIGTATFTFHLDPADKQSTFQLTKYEILEKIGRGGMGIVYKARQKSMDRIVALKVLHERFARDKDFVERFIREAQAAGKLSHPNIIHVHDVSKEKGLYFFSMEYVEGMSVMTQIIERERIEPGEALNTVKQVAKALEFAHANNLIHRDIKPDNIMVTPENEVKLADLGIARNLQEANDELQQKTIYGTPLYMAPEQAMGRQVDHRLDIYSLGATFYHMVTGAPPFQGSTAIELLKKHINEPAVPPDEVVPEIPSAVSDQILIMMAKNPDDRYQSASELVAEIEQIQRGGRVSTKRALSETSILRRLSSQDLEPSVNVVDFAADEHVKELIALDPKKKKTILLVGLFVIGLIGVFLLTIFASDIFKKKLDNPAAPLFGRPTAEEMLAQLPALREQSLLSEELQLISRIQSELPADDPRVTELTARAGFLSAFLALPDADERVQTHLKNYTDILRYVTASPEDSDVILALSEQCLQPEFADLFPERSTEISAIRETYAARRDERLREEELKAFNAIAGHRNTELNDFIAVKEEATRYTARFGDMHPEHLQEVNKQLTIATEGLEFAAKLLEEKNTKRMDMLNLNLESAFENKQYDQVYSLCTDLKSEFRNTLWESKVDELQKAYAGRLDSIYKKRAAGIDTAFRNREFQKVLKEAADLTKDFSSTPHSDPAAKLVKTMQGLVNKEFSTLTSGAAAESAQFQYNKARLMVLKEIHNFMGTPYQKGLEELSDACEALDDLWSYLLSKGENITVELPEPIVHTGSKNVLKGMRAQGIYLEYGPADMVSTGMRVTEWEKLTNRNIYIVFRTILISTKAPAELYGNLAVFCRQRTMPEEQKEAEALAQKVKEREAAGTP